jgi:UDP-galactopyranose mutase
MQHKCYANVVIPYCLENKEQEKKVHRSSTDPVFFQSIFDPVVNCEYGICRYRTLRYRRGTVYVFS